MADFITSLDGKWHKITDQDITVCGLTVPHTNEWVRERPDGKACPECFPEAKKK